MADLSPDAEDEGDYSDRGAECKPLYALCDELRHSKARRPTAVLCCQTVHLLCSGQIAAERAQVRTVVRDRRAASHTAMPMNSTASMPAWIAGKAPVAAFTVVPPPKICGGGVVEEATTVLI